MSGSSRLWTERDKGASTEGTRGMTEGTVGGLIKGGMDEWKGEIGDRRSPFVRHAPPAFLCLCHSFPKFLRANPSARLRVSVPNTYSVIIIHFAFSSFPRLFLSASSLHPRAVRETGERKRGSGGVCSPFVLTHMVTAFIFYTYFKLLNPLCQSSNILSRTVHVKL